MQTMDVVDPRRADVDGIASRAVGALAKLLYPGGIEVSADSTNFEHASQQT